MLPRRTVARMLRLVRRIRDTGAQPGIQHPRLGYPDPAVGGGHWVGHRRVTLIGREPLRARSRLARQRNLARVRGAGQNDWDRASSHGIAKSALTTHHTTTNTIANRIALPTGVTRKWVFPPTGLLSQSMIRRVTSRLRMAAMTIDATDTKDK